MLLYMRPHEDIAISTQSRRVGAEVGLCRSKLSSKRTGDLSHSFFAIISRLWSAINTGWRGLLGVFGTSYPHVH